MIEILANHVVGAFLIILSIVFCIGGWRMWDVHEDFLTVSGFLLSGFCLFFGLVFFDLIGIVV